MIRVKLAVIALWCLSLPGLHAQVVARQGDPGKAAKQDFTSPMVLDLPLTNFAALRPGQGREFKEAGQYYCDDTVLSYLLVSRPMHAKGGKDGLDIKGKISVRPSHDRLVTLRFDAMKGERKFGSAQVADVSAEEGQTRKFATRMRLTTEEFEQLFAAGDAPLLRVTVTVVDNA